MTDIEIAKQVNLENILDIAKKTNIDENDVELYGKYKAKISNFEKYNKNSKGKLVLVTAMSPTPLGEPIPDKPTANATPKAANIKPPLFSIKNCIHVFIFQILLIFL